MFHELTKLVDSDTTDDIVILLAALPVATLALLATRRRKLWTGGLILSMTAGGLWAVLVGTWLSDPSSGDCSARNSHHETRALIGTVVATAVVLPLVASPRLLTLHPRLRWIAVPASLAPAMTLVYLVATITGCD